MIEWLGASNRRVRDFASAIQPELMEMPVPRATDDLLERVRASRSAGARIILPADDRRSRRGVVWYASAVAAAAVVVFVLSRMSRPDSDVAAIGAPGSWFGGRPAFAQERVVVPLPPVRVTIADRLRPMRLVYERIMRDSTGRVRSRTNVELRIDRDDSDAASLWRVVSTERDASRPSWFQTDTLHVTRDLRLVSASIVEAPYRSFSRIAVSQHVDGLRLSGTMQAERGGIVSARRTFDRSLPSESAPFVTDAFAPLFLMGVALDANWKGRVSILGWAVRDDDVFVPVGMRVIGEETLRLPSGEFRCWRLSLAHGGRRTDYWVRQSDGLGVRSLDSTRSAGQSQREIRLISPRSD